MQPATKPASEDDAANLSTSYLSSLPRGLASYPGCTAKGSLFNAFLAAKPIHPTSVPGPLQALFARPVRTNEWIPETHFLALSLLVRERHFRSDQSFLQWVKVLNAQLFKGPIYRALMFVATPPVLVAGTGLRWRQFHQGTMLIAEHGAGRWVDFRFRYEPRLLEPLHVQLFLAAIEAALEATGAQRCETSFVETTGTEARARIKW